MSDQQPPTAVGGPEPTPEPVVGPPPSHLAPSTASVREDRPPPSLISLAGAFAGLLLLASLFLLLGDLGGGSRRPGGIVLGLLFELLGVALILMNRGRRGATAGVLLTALGLVPLLVYLFVDVQNPGRTINSVGKFTSTTTLILAVAAVLWLAAYFFGPARRYGFYLGAALIALWLVAIVQIVDQPLRAVFDPFVASSTFERVRPSTDFGGSSGGSTFSQSCTTGSDGVVECSSSTSGTDFGSRADDPFDQSAPSPELPFSRRSTQPDNPSIKIGVASLLFGAAYLALAGRRDRKEDHRQATVFFAAAIPILTIGVLFLTGPLDTIGASLLAIALGAVTIWLGTRAGRRFSSWYATVAVVIAVLALVNKLAGDSNRVSAAILAAIGLATVVALSRLEGDSEAGDVPTEGPPLVPWASSTPTVASGPAGGSSPGPWAGTHGTSWPPPSSGASPSPWEAPADRAPTPTPGPDFSSPPTSGWAPPESTEDPASTEPDSTPPPHPPSP